MIWPRSRLRRELEDARALVEDLRRQAWTLSHAVLKEQAEKDLIRQAKEKAEADALYWRTRAEIFLDQIAAKAGMIFMPTMTEAPTPSEDKLDSVFSALGVAEIHRDNSPSTGAAHAAPRVEGVNPAAAQAAVDDVLADVGGRQRFA